MSRLIKSRYLTGLIIGYLVILTGLVVLIGLNFQIPTRDSGAFLYAGHQILHGAVPYRDFWDHKPPLIYYLNSTSQIISPGQLWGLWLMEFVFIFSFLGVLFYLTNKIFGRLISLTSITIIALSIALLIEGGNRVEEYALLFQSLAVLSAWKIQSAKSFPQPVFAAILGLSGSLLFLLKPTLVTVFLVALGWIYITSKHKRPVFIACSYFLVSLLLITLYFAFRGALPDLWDQIFYFNSLYSVSTIAKRSFSVYFGQKLLWPDTLFVFLGLLYVLFSRSKLKTPPLIKLVALWYPLEIIISSLSGRVYHHYYLSWLPPMTLLLAFFLHQLVKLFSHLHIKKLISFPLVIFFFSLAYYPRSPFLIKKLDDHKPFDSHFQFRHYVYNNFLEHADTLNLISSITSPADPVLIWGSEPALLYLSDRSSPGKFFYQLRLFYPGYNTLADKTAEFLTDIQTKPPKLIIDASKSASDQNLDSPTLPELTGSDYTNWSQSTLRQSDHSIIQLFAFVKNNYRYIGSTYAGQWRIYQHL